MKLYRCVLGLGALACMGALGCSEGSSPDDKLPEGACSLETQTKCMANGNFVRCNVSAKTWSSREEACPEGQTCDAAQNKCAPKTNPGPEPTPQCTTGQIKCKANGSFVR